MPKRVAKKDKQDEAQNCKKAREDEKNWNNMPNEIKVMIMNNMDYITRNRLKMCSKADKCLVEAFPVVIPYIGASNRQRCLPRKPACFFLHDPPSNNVSLKVERLETLVRIWKYGKLRTLHRSSKNNRAPKVVDGFFYGILLAKNLRIEKFETKWSLNESFIPDGQMFHFDTVGISIGDGKECVKWLKHIAPGVKEISTEYGAFLEGVGDLPCVLNAKELSFHDSDINDDQLLNFKATDLTFTSSNVTVEGVFKFIKKWINEDYPIGSRLRIDKELRGENDLIIEQVFEGFEYELVEGRGKYVTIAMGSNKKMRLTIHEGIYCGIYSKN